MSCESYDFIIDKRVGLLYDVYQVVCNLTVLQVTPSDYIIKRMTVRVHSSVYLSRCLQARLCAGAHLVTRVKRISEGDDAFHELLSINGRFLSFCCFVDETRMSARKFRSKPSCSTAYLRCETGLSAQ